MPAVPDARPYRGLSDTEHRRSLSRGLTQLSLVEHALCPLDSDLSLRPGLEHTAEYFFTDRESVRRKATARVLCPTGLSANDELYLWGLLALTFSQPQPGIEFPATPHYCLRQLGLIEPGAPHGGENYRLFREAIERLSAVTYQNDGFYDPIRGEHCRVSFGFFSYRLPLTDGSSRAWRFYWDPLWFEIAKASGSALAFDLPTYRELDQATRRLYLLLKKMFWRRSVLPPFDVRHLAVNVLGFSPAQEPWRLKARLAACIERLIEHGILATPETSVADLFRKQGKGRYNVLLERGPHFDHKPSARVREVIDSPLFELLQTIGFDPPSAAKVIQTYQASLVAEWIDITLAARERNGVTFFKKSPQAYFLDNVRNAAAGTRTPPDWWRAMRREEDRRQRRAPPAEGDAEAAFDRYLETEARAAFERVTESIFASIKSSLANEYEARLRARVIARGNLKTQFYREHPELRPTDAPLSDVSRRDDE